MEEKFKLIDLQGLKSFLSALKNFIKDYFDSRIDNQLSDESENPVQNKVIKTELEAMKNEYGSLVWFGTQEEYEEAYAKGEIAYGTIVNITDDYEDLSLEETTYDEIVELFR